MSQKSIDHLKIASQLVSRVGCSSSLILGSSEVVELVTVVFDRPEIVAL